MRHKITHTIFDPLRLQHFPEEGLEAIRLKQRRFLSPQTFLTPHRYLGRCGVSLADVAKRRGQTKCLVGSGLVRFRA